MQQNMHNRSRSDYSNASNLNSFMTRIQNVEEVLNKVCCDHDSLMPILQLGTYLPSLTRWQTQFKNINHKINQYENQLNDIINQQQIVNQVPLQLIRTIENIQQSIAHCQKVLSQLEGKLKGNTLTLEGAIINNGIQRKLSEVSRYSQTYLASFKNEIEMQQKQIQYGDDIKMNSILKQQIEPTLCKQVDKMMVEIQILKSQLPQVDLIDFHSFNCSRLKYEITQCNQIGQKYDKQGNISEEDWNIFRERINWIQWQIKGTFKKYLRQFTHFYLQKDHHYDTHCLQLKLVNHLSDIELQFSELKLKFSYLQQKIKRCK